MGKLVISQKIESKLLDRHGVTVEEVRECFANCVGGLLTDNREEHKTNPPTEWFIAETNRGRRLKVIFVEDNGSVYLKSAFAPNGDEERMYAKVAKS